MLSSSIRLTVLLYNINVRRNTLVLLTIARVSINKRLSDLN